MGDKNDTCHIASYASFYAYRILSEYDTENYENELGILKREGFSVPFHTVVKQGGLNSETLMSIYQEFLAKAPWEIDGLVIQSNENCKYENEYYPANTRAFKANELAAESIITGIDWRMTKDGSLSPIAQIEPVMLNGSKDSLVLFLTYAFVFALLKPNNATN